MDRSLSAPSLNTAAPRVNFSLRTVVNDNVNSRSVRVSDVPLIARWAPQFALVCPFDRGH